MSNRGLGAKSDIAAEVRGLVSSVARLTLRVAEPGFRS